MDIFRNTDAFEQRLTFSNNNRLKYKSCFGSICTICIIVLLLVYFIILLTSPMKLVNTTTTTNQINSQSGSDTTDTTDTTDTNSTGNILIFRLSHFSQFVKHQTQISFSQLDLKTFLQTLLLMHILSSVNRCLPIKFVRISIINLGLHQVNLKLIVKTLNISLLKSNSTFVLLSIQIIGLL